MPSTGETMVSVRPSTSFLYDGATITQELTGGTPTANLLTGSAPDEMLTRSDTGGSTTFLTDALGSPLELTDGSGTLQTHYTYTPFDSVVSSGAMNGNSQQFTGRENDSTGLLFYRARYYQPQFQRFISEDPLGVAGGLNLFTYAGNAPTNAVDPTGLFTCKWHRMLTTAAATNAGYTLNDAMALAQKVCDVDKDTESDQPADTQQHAMGGRKSNGNCQNCQEAYDEAKNWLTLLEDNGQLAQALHLIEDQWSTSHRYQPWYGLGQSPTALARHAYPDPFPSVDVLRQASADASRFMQDFLNHHLGDPSQYLHDSCK